MRELILNFFSYSFAVALERLCSFLLIPLYASTFTVAEFGVIDIVQTTIGVVLIFAFLQLETSLQRYYYEYESKERKIFCFYYIFCHTFIGAIACFVGMYLCGNIKCFIV